MDKTQLVPYTLVDESLTGRSLSDWLTSKVNKNSNILAAFSDLIDDETQEVSSVLAENEVSENALIVFGGKTWRAYDLFVACKQAMLLDIDDIEYPLDHTLINFEQALQNYNDSLMSTDVCAVAMRMTGEKGSNNLDTASAFYQACAIKFTSITGVVSQTMSTIYDVATASGASVLDKARAILNCMGMDHVPETEEDVVDIEYSAPSAIQDLTGASPASIVAADVTEAIENFDASSVVSAAVSTGKVIWGGLKSLFKGATKVVTKVVNTVSEKVEELVVHPNDLAIVEDFDDNTVNDFGPSCTITANSSGKFGGWIDDAIAANKLRAGSYVHVALPFGTFYVWYEPEDKQVRLMLRRSSLSESSYWNYGRGSLTKAMKTTTTGAGGTVYWTDESALVEAMSDVFISAVKGGNPNNFPEDEAFHYGISRAGQMLSFVMTALDPYCQEISGYQGSSYLPWDYFKHCLSNGNYSSSTNPDGAKNTTPNNWIVPVFVVGELVDGEVTNKQLVTELMSVNGYSYITDLTGNIVFDYKCPSTPASKTASYSEAPSNTWWRAINTICYYMLTDDIFFPYEHTSSLSIGRYGIKSDNDNAEEIYSALKSVALAAAAIAVTVLVTKGLKKLRLASFKSSVNTNVAVNKYKDAVAAGNYTDDELNKLASAAMKQIKKNNLLNMITGGYAANVSAMLSNASGTFSASAVDFSNSGKNNYINESNMKSLFSKYSTSQLDAIEDVIKLIRG